MTTPDEPPVPIIPGPSYEPPTPPYPAAPVPPPAQQPQPQPVYYQHPPQAPTWNPGRAAGNTVVVILTIVGIVIFLPLLCCGFWLMFGSVLGLADTSN